MKQGLALLGLVVFLASCGAPRAGAARTRPADGMVMVYVPAGAFLRGTTEAQARPVIDACLAEGSSMTACRTGPQGEMPQRSITLGAFWIDRTEVTNAQYRACVQAGACAEPGCWDEASYSADDQPVVCVNWEKACAYCQWAGARLPTEAEWEKAARGTDGRIYPWGDEAPACDRANYRGEAGGCVGRPSVVGSYPSGASPYGALDMAGNAQEWVSDWHGYRYYAEAPDQDPIGPDAGNSRVLRGGAWFSEPDAVRSASRDGLIPDLYSPVTGFRCAMPAGG